MKQRAADWPEWAGGVALITPWVAYCLLALASAETNSAWLRVGLVVVLLGEFAVLALLAPLVGYQRRYVLWGLLPVWGWRIAWVFGTRLVRLAQTGSTEPDGELQLTG